MKELQACEVIWHDAHGGDCGDWVALPKKIVHEPERVRTVGQLYQRDQLGATVILSRTESGDTDAYIFIPAPCIVSVKELH